MSHGNEVKGSREAIGGFIAFLLTWVGLLIYIFWSGVSESSLHAVQFTYYPDKYWAVAAPAFLIVAFYYYWTTYMLSYMRNTKPLDDMFCLTDTKAKGSGRTMLGALTDAQSSIPPITDIPVNVTSRIFHQAWEAKK